MDAAELLTAYRTTEARFSGEVRHAPCPASLAERVDVADSPVDPAHSGSRECGTLPAPGSPAFKQLVQALQDLRTEAREGASHDLRHSMAVADIVLAPRDEAAANRSIRRLDALHSIGYRPPDLLNDLAAAHITRWKIGANPVDLIAALDMASQALRADSTHVAAAFNRALALERLRLPTAAARAWARLTEIDADPGWRAEAVERLQRLSAQPSRLQWRSTLDSALAAADLAQLHALARSHAQFARETLLWEILPQWGQVMLEVGEQAAMARLQDAEALARALSAGGGDYTPLSATEAIRSLITTSRHDDLAAVARAWSSLGKARTARVHAYDYAAAEALLGAVAPTLREMGEGVRLQVETMFAALEMQTGRVRSGEARFRRVIAETDSSRYPAIAGRCLWGMGLAAIRMGRVESAGELLARARGAYESAGEDENVGAVLAMLADLQFQSGGAWAGLLTARDALLRLPPADPSTWRYNLLLGLAGRAVAQGYSAAAAELLTHALHEARALGPALIQVEASIRRGRLRRELGNRDGAMEDLRGARRALTQVTTGRSYFEAQIKDEEAQLDMTGVASIRELEALEVEIRRESRLILLPALLHRQAETHLALSDTATAREILDRALAQVSAMAEGTADPTTGVNLLRKSEAMYDLAIELAVAERDIEGALALLQRSQTISRGSSGVPGPWTSEPGVPRVQFAVLESELLAFVSAQGSLHLVRTPVDSATLRLALDRWEAGEGTAKVLYRYLIAPLEALLIDAHRLVVVPDRVLTRVPFAALPTPDGGPLVERLAIVHATATAPRSSGMRAVLERREGRSLVVAGSSFDRSWFRELAPLPGAQQEARRTAALLPSADILLGDQATPEAVLAALPGSRVFHFAGHALLSPGMDGGARLVLARGEDGRSSVDQTDIRSLDLRDLELVVLSACETAGANPGRAGAMAGLAAAFLTAGAGGVVATLSRVDDTQTAEFMHAFHRAREAGLDPGAALQAAQLDASRREAPNSAPPFWARFVFLTS